METTTISRNVELSQSSLHNNYLDDIYKNLCSRYKDTCTEETGYIIDIYDDIKIISNRISNNDGNAIFLMEFKADILKPEINNVITCKVDMVFIHGIFAGINKLKILIPNDTLSDYNFNQSTSTYIHKKSKHAIKKDDMIKKIARDLNFIGPLSN